ncbi:MAG: type II secretion system protein GspC [Pseudomonadota bacterium]|nr:MAG: general secretion pathway protein GspC [Pseudomonadota bacterium]
MALDSLLRKYYLLVVLALIATAAYFQASGATELFGAALLTPTGGDKGQVLPPSTPPSLPRREPRSADPIIDRNPFDSVTGPLHPKPEETVAPPPELDFSDPLSAPPCEGINALIVTESSDPSWSVAALQANGEPQPRMRRAGDEVQGKKVVFIGYNPREATPAVWLSGGGQLCQAQLFRSASAASATPSAAATPPPPQAEPPAPLPPPTSGRRGPKPLPPEIASKIQKVSDTEFNVDRTVVDKILEDQAELMRSARIVPEQKDGKVVGVRLFGIRPDTLLGALGLQNGDRLESINGFNMASPEKALEAYARLRTASNLNVKVNRRGSPVSIDYRIK